MAYPDRVPAWRRYLGLIRPSIARDVDDELRFHLQSRVEDLMARGSSADAAWRTAREDLGDIDRTRSNLLTIGRRRAARGRRGEWMRDALGDVRYAARSLLPGADVN